MYLKKYNLKNKYALVTGAGKGLGKACAIALAEAGCNLIIISRTKKDLDSVAKIIKKLKVKCKPYVCDLTSYNQIKSIKGDYQNGLLTSDEMIEHLEDLVHDVEGNDEYGFGTSMEDDGFYDDLPDFTQLEV